MHSPQRTSAKRWTAAIRLILICLLLLMGSLSSNAAVPTPDAGGFEVVSLPAEALSAPVGFAQAMSVSSNTKMDSDLAALATAGSAAAGDALAAAESGGLRLLGDRVQVKITTHPEGVQSVTEAVSAAGGEVTGSANGDTWLQAWIPLGALDTIAAREDVDYISRPADAVLLDPDLTLAATTEGLAVINGPAWHAGGFRGVGVKVAIIDGGFQGYPGLRGSELPASVTVKNFVDGESEAQVNGTTVHGTACAEIVHDIAPDASLYLAKINTDIDLQEAVNWVKTQGVHIISTSMGWYSLTPGDGTGFFANLVQSTRTAGIFWTTAASNDREAHWGGAYSDSNSNSYHNFNGTQEIDYFGPGNGDAYLIPAGNAIRVFLRWDDWSAKNQNYDLFIVKWNGSSWTTVASGTNLQNGGAGQTPTEYVGVMSSGSSAPYGFIIKRVSSSRNVNFEVFAPKVARLDELVHARSLANLADAPAAMTVAALDVDAPYPQESYSSEGPTNGPGGTAAGGAIKPDIAAFANVSTASYPDPTDKFNGTSSATPHVAGAAALVKGANPAYTPAQIQSFLQGRAIDMGSAGKDTIYGYGRLSLGAPPSGPVFTRKTFLPLVRKSPPLPAAPVLNAIDNADGDGNYAVSWGAPADATSYTLEEDDNGGFSSPTTQYTGAGTSWNATGKAVGTYYYRAKASNAVGNSGWSNVQAVSVQPSLPSELTPIADATVLQALPSTNAGDTTDMWTGYEHCNSSLQGIVRSLIRFDVTGIPAGSIASARLYLYLGNSCDMGNRTHVVNTYRATGNWAEMTVNWNNKPGSGTAYGSASILSQNWGWYSFDLTALVRGWANGTIPNYGVIIRGPESSGNDSARLGFTTREASADYQPYLKFGYTAASSAQGNGSASVEPARPLACGRSIAKSFGSADQTPCLFCATQACAEP